MKLKMTCERIQVNNGIVQLYFVRRADMSDPKSQEQTAIFNLQISPDEFRLGEPTWIELVHSFEH